MIQKILEPIIKVHRGEWPKVLLMFFYFFFVIATYYIVKPVRSSIFLDRLGSEQLPWVYMGEALVVGIVAFFYSKFVDRHKKENILLTSTAIFSGCLFAFWFLFKTETAWFAYLFYLWGAIFSVMSVTQFWLLANDLFNPREAKRLFGIIGSGGVLGAIFGGALTGYFVRLIGTENLLVIAGCLILLCVLFIKIACRYEPAEIRKASGPNGETSPQGSRRHLWEILTSSNFIFLILLLIGTGKIISTFVDFQFQSVVDASFATKDSKTAYFALFFSYLNSAAFLIQLVLTHQILKRMGLKKALLLLPIGLVLGMTGLVVLPLLWAASFVKFYDGSLNYSIHSAAKEILYLPIPRTDRHKIKPFIDMFIYRLAKGIGGFFILILISFLHLGLWGVSLAGLGILGVWILITFLIKRRYTVELLKALARESGSMARMEADFEVPRRFPRLRRLALESELFEVQKKDLSGGVVRTIFDVLARYYSRDFVMRLRDLFLEGDDYLRANVAEFLDNVLSCRSKRIVLPILEKEAKK